MYLNKINIESTTGHFGKVLGYDDRATYDAPTPSTVIGMLKVIYGDDIDNFTFGYLFKSSLKFNDDITIHKRNSLGKRVKKGENFTSDIRRIEYLYDCSLTIYTDINKEIEMNYILTMGKAGNPAKLNLPIKSIELFDKDGKGFNQFTTKEIGTGRILSCNMLSKYNPKYDSYDNQIELLRFNKEFNYDNYFDDEEGQNIFLWQVNNGVVKNFNG